MAIEIPKEVGQAEAALRRKHVAEMTEHASGQPAEIYRYLSARGRKITRSMPVRDYVEKRRKLKLAFDQLGGSPLDWSGGKPVSPAGAYIGAIKKLDQDNEYPPGLVAEVEKRLLSGSPCQIPHLADAVEEAVNV